MIADVMLYGTAVALLIALASLALERIATWRALPFRGIYALALVLSLALPALRMMEAHQDKTTNGLTASRLFPTEPPMANALIAPRARVALPTRSIKPQLETKLHWPAIASLDRYFRAAWIAGSSGLTLLYLVLWLRLRIDSRHWHRHGIGAQEVWVTEALGPAVYGFVRSRILLPRWALDLPAVSRSLVLAHEREHLAVRDPLLLLLGLAIVAAAPWNLPLWWQLRRLRFAIEVDCDARVLSRGADARAYGEILLTVGQHRFFTPMGAVALTEPASQLRRRIRVMTSNVRPRSAWFVTAALLMSAACGAVAVQLDPPVLAPAFLVGSISSTSVQAQSPQRSAHLVLSQANLSLWEPPALAPGLDEAPGLPQASGSADIIATLKVNNVPITLEQTSFRDVQQRLGGVVGSNGKEAGNRLSWICLYKPDAPNRQIIWLEGDELHDKSVAGFQWREIPADHLPDKRCKALAKGSEIALPLPIHPGDTRAQALALMGIPTTDYGGLLLYVHSHSVTNDNNVWTTINTVEIQLRGDLVKAIAVWKVTTN